MSSEHKKGETFMIVYKLTDEHNMTRNKTLWGENVTHIATGDGKTLCSNGYIHFYSDPYLAIIMNPKHADFRNPVLWEAYIKKEDVKGIISDGTKSGVKRLTTVKVIVTKPAITVEQCVEFTIRVVKIVYKDEKWNAWADDWLSGKDRSRSVATAAAASAAASAAADYAAAAAYYAVYAVVYAAAANAVANYAASAAADYAAANAVAYYAAYAVANAASAATYAVNAANATNNFPKRINTILKKVFYKKDI